MKRLINSLIGFGLLVVCLSGCSIFSGGSSSGGNTHVHTGDRPVEENRIDPTCTEQGSYDLVTYCIDDHYEMSREHQTIPALGHDFVSDVHPATYDKDGYIVYTCSRCGYTYQEDGEHRLEHHYSEKWSIDEENGTHYHACIDEGYEDLRANENSHTYTYEVIKEVTATEDGLKRGTCDICHHQIEVTERATGTKEKLRFYLNNETNTYTVDALSTEIEGEVIIPQYYNDLEVTKVDGFSSCKKITSVVIPSSVTRICRTAFYQCLALTSVTFADNSKLNTIDESAFYNCASLKTIVIPKDVKEISSCTFESCNALESVTFSEYSKLTSINSEAFKGCCALEEINIPSNVTSIGEEAFYECEALTKIAFPKSLTSIGKNVFYECSSLTTVTFEEGSKLTAIGDTLFSNCSSLTSISIPNGVTSLGEGAFVSCSSLTTVTFEEGSKLTAIGDALFSSCSNLTSIEIPSNVTSIGDGAFIDCKSLSSITIPKNVTIIDGYAFRGCSSLLSVTFEEGSKLTSLGEYVFSGCGSLRQIRLPDNVTSIGDGAFIGCSMLTIANVPDGVKELGKYVFYDCLSLVSLEFGSGLTSYDSYTFYRMPKLYELFNRSSMDIDITQYSLDPLIRYTKHVITKKEDSKTSVDNEGFVTYKDGDEVILTGYVGNKTDLVIPNYVTTICDYAFSECKYLTSVVIQNGVTYIGGYAFSECTSLKSVTIPNTVEIIGGEAFSECTSLTSIVIPNSVNEMYSSIFYGCTSLESLTIPFIGYTPNDYQATYFGYLFGNDEHETSGSFVPESLKTVVIGEKCTHIKTYAFKDCTSITSITLPSTLVDCGTGSDVFMNCASLTEINVNENNKNYCSVDGVLYNKDKTTLIRYPMGKKAKDYTVLAGVTTLYFYAFGGCNALESVTLSQTMEVILNYAFEYCTSLSSINIPSGLTIIADYAFNYCSSLHYSEYGGAYYLGDKNNDYLILTAAKDKTATSVEINSNCRIIRNDAFNKCTNLSSIIIPDSVVSIGERAFSNCYSLTNIVISSNIKKIGDLAFDGCTKLTTIGVSAGNKYFSSEGGVLYDYNKSTLVCYPLAKPGTSFVVPTSVVTIGTAAFKGNTRLTSITFPDQLTRIGIEAFANCTGLTYVSTPGVTIIKSSAFANCVNLKTLFVNEGTLSMEEDAFYRCSSLSSVTIPSTLRRLTTRVFGNCTYLKSLTYTGTMSEWNAMTIEDRWKEGSSIASVHCLDGIIEF